MTKGSDYFDLNSIPEGWTSEEFRFAVLSLEALPETDLRMLLDVFGIVFTSGNGKADQESMVMVLIDDAPKEDLLKKLEFRRGVFI